MRYTLSLLLTLFLFAACTRQTQLIGQPESSRQPTAESLQQIETPMGSPMASPIVTVKPTLKPIRTTSSTTIKIIQLSSSFHSDEKRTLSSVDTVVIHSVYNPNTADHFSIASIKKVFDESEVSSHFVITRDGHVYQLVSEEYQAWHAGVSTMPSPDGRSGVNAFSIGIELVGNESSGFTEEQYQSLTRLITEESKKLPLKTITGHADIAPERKTDPWKFDWKKFSTLLANDTIVILHSQ